MIAREIEREANRLGLAWRWPPTKPRIFGPPYMLYGLPIADDLICDLLYPFYAIDVPDAQAGLYSAHGNRSSRNES